MGLTEQELQIIDKKLMKQLCVEEEVLFEQKIKDPEFNKEYLNSIQSYHAIINSESERLKSRLKKIDQQKAPSSLFNGSGIKYLLIGLLLIAIVIGSYLVYHTYFANQTPQQLYAQYYQPASNDIYPITRSGNQSKIKQGFYAYDTKDYEKTIELFNSLGKEKEASSIRYFTAQAHMARNEKAEAKSIFQQFAESNNDYQAQSLWYLSLIELENGNTRAASGILNQLKEESTYKKKEVTSLLSELEGMN